MILSQSFFQNLSFTIFLSQSFFHTLSITICLSQSFFHNLPFTIFLSQSFFHNLSFTIFLSQSFFHNLFSQSLKNLGRIVVPSGTCLFLNDDGHPVTHTTQPLKAISFVFSLEIKSSSKVVYSISATSSLRVINEEKFLLTHVGCHR